MEDLDLIPTFTITATKDTQPLTQQEVEYAKKELVFPPYPVFNTRFSDGFIKKNDPSYALFSFIPRVNTNLLLFYKEIAPLLSPEQQKKLDDLVNDQKYIHGVGKIRGAYVTVKEAEKASEKIIKNIDSTNSVFICKIGEPFPLVVRGFAEEVKKIDINNVVEKTMVENIKQKQARDKREIEEIRKREQQLNQPVEMSPHISDLDNYITIRVRLAHTRYELDKIEQKNIELSAREKDCVSQLLELDSSDPSFEKEYMDRFNAGRESVGLNVDGKLESYLSYIQKPIK